MVTLCHFEPPAAKRAPSQTSEITSPLSGSVDRSFNASGNSSCERPTVVVRNAADNSIVWGPTTVTGYETGPGEYYWTTPIDLTQNYAGVNVIVYCQTEGDGQSVGGLEVVEGVQVIELTSDPGDGPKKLKFTFRINNWRGTDQSSVLVVHGRTAAGNPVKYSHVFSDAVPPIVSYDFGTVGRGVYVGKFTFIDGQISVTTRISIKVI
jgi:hypothetical protein